MTVAPWPRLSGFLNMMSIGRNVAATCVALAAALLLAGCERAPAEQRLRDTINAMQEAAENGDRGAFMERVDSNFGGQRGQFDRRSLDGILRMQMMTHQNIGSTITDLDLTLMDQRATTTMKVLLTGGPRAWLPENAELLEVTAGWVDTDDGWRLISADWR
ncbi:MAG: nuclear transport factor 2 family protein [Pseudomonadota bacterium]